MVAWETNTQYNPECLLYSYFLEKVYNALNFLIANNPIYADVRLSNVDLPDDDVPEEILRTFNSHEVRLFILLNK